MISFTRFPWPSCPFEASELKRGGKATIVVAPRANGPVLRSSCAWPRQQHSAGGGVAA